VASMLFILVCVQVVVAAGAGEGPGRVWTALGLAAVLAGGYLGLSVRDACVWLHEAPARPVLRLVAGLVALVGATVTSGYVEGFAVFPRAAAYSAYLLAPGAVLVYGTGTRDVA